MPCRRAQEEDDSEVDVANSQSTFKMLRSIQKSITSLEIKQQDATKAIANLNHKMNNIAASIPTKDDFAKTTENLTEKFMEELNSQNKRLETCNDRLDNLADGLSRLSVRTTELAKDKEDTEVNMARNFSVIEQEKTLLHSRITTLENKFNQLEKAQITSDKGNQQASMSTKLTQDLRDQKNVILEGLNEMQDEDVCDTAIKAINEIGFRIYENDINRAYRIGNFKGFDTWPRPIRLELVSERIRQRVIENRHKMPFSHTHYRVRISKDEPKETRRAEAIM